MKGDNSLSADCVAGDQEDQEEEDRPEGDEDHGGGRSGAPARFAPQLGLSHHTAGLV